MEVELESQITRNVYLQSEINQSVECSANITSIHELCSYVARQVILSSCIEMEGI